MHCTGFSSEIGTKLRDWAVWQAGGSCYSQAALSSNDSKTPHLDSDELLMIKFVVVTISFLLYNKE